MKQIEIKGTIYYINEVESKIVYNETLIELGRALYLHKNVDEMTLDFLGYMNKVTQPSKEQVYNATLWAYDSYTIATMGGKRGYGYVSSISVPTDNGNVVILKKWNKDFKKVLITYKELENLFNKCATQKQKYDREYSLVKSAVKMYVKLTINDKKTSILRNLIVASEYSDKAVNFWLEKAIYERENTLSDKMVKECNKRIKILSDLLK